MLKNIGKDAGPDAPSKGEGPGHPNGAGPLAHRLPSQEQGTWDTSRCPPALPGWRHHDRCSREREKSTAATRARQALRPAPKEVEARKGFWSSDGECERTVELRKSRAAQLEKMKAARKLKGRAVDTLETGRTGHRRQNALETWPTTQPACALSAPCRDDYAPFWNSEKGPMDMFLMFEEGSSG